MTGDDGPEVEMLTGKKSIQYSSRKKLLE